MHKATTGTDEGGGMGRDGGGMKAVVEGPTLNYIVRANCQITFEILYAPHPSLVKLDERDPRIDTISKIGHLKGERDAIFRAFVQCLGRYVENCRKSCIFRTAYNFGIHLMRPILCSVDKYIDEYQNVCLTQS